MSVCVFLVFGCLEGCFNWSGWYFGIPELLGGVRGCFWRFTPWGIQSDWSQLTILAQPWKARIFFTWRFSDIKISKPPYLPFPQMTEFCHFSYFSCLSERNYNLQSLWITLYVVHISQKNCALTHLPDNCALTHLPKKMCSTISSQNKQPQTWTLNNTYFQEKCVKLQISQIPIKTVVEKQVCTFSKTNHWCVFFQFPDQRNMIHMKLLLKNGFFSWFFFPLICTTSLVFNWTIFVHFCWQQWVLHISKLPTTILLWNSTDDMGRFLVPFIFIYSASKNLKKEILYKFIFCAESNVCLVWPQALYPPLYYVDQRYSVLLLSFLCPKLKWIWTNHSCWQADPLVGIQVLTRTPVGNGNAFTIYS